MALIDGLIVIGSVLGSERRNVVLVCLLVVMALVYEMIASQLMSTTGSFYSAIADNDRRLFAGTIIQSITIVMLLALVKATRAMLREYSALSWRVTLVTLVSKQLLSYTSSKDLFLQGPQAFLSSLDQR